MLWSVQVVLSSPAIVSLVSRILAPSFQMKFEGLGLGQIVVSVCQSKVVKNSLIFVRITNCQ